MTIKRLITVELKKFALRSYGIQVLIANLGIAILVGMTIAIPYFAGEEIPQLATTTVIDTVTKSVFIVWEAVLIAQLIVEEFRSKTILLLFSYPINRKWIIISKLCIVGGLTLVSMLASQTVQNGLFFMLNHLLPAVNYSITFTDIVSMGVTTVTSMLLGMLPLYIGMLNKSTVATVVSSLLIVSLTISSGGQNGAGLITVLPVSIMLAVIGAAMTTAAIKNMLSEDIIL